jgi:EAL domain-containing protein (putative c-di-GMP-specific phosphodiesterase class I)
MQDIEYSAKVFQGLRELGVRVAIDDFGTGFSSLAALNRLPITSLKIDGSFVRSCVEDPSSRAIVSAIIGTANALGFSIVAEGVETNEQLEVLRNLVCDRAQGHLFSSPLPGSDLRQMMASPTPWSQS